MKRKSIGFVIPSVLREAGMARILLVEHASDSLPVCLKFLNSKTCSRTLEQECRALMRLSDTLPSFHEQTCSGGTKLTC
jgi:hypothetical protein